jgi:hypothetical protein
MYGVRMRYLILQPISRFHRYARGPLPAKHRRSGTPVSRISAGLMQPHRKSSTGIESARTHRPESMSVKVD